MINFRQVEEKETKRQKSDQLMQIKKFKKKKQSHLRWSQLLEMHHQTLLMKSPKKEKEQLKLREIQTTGNQQFIRTQQIGRKKSIKLRQPEFQFIHCTSIRMIKNLTKNLQLTEENLPSQMPQTKLKDNRHLRTYSNTLLFTVLWRSIVDKRKH